MKRNPAAINNTQYCFFNLPLAIRSKTYAYEILGTAILKWLKWTTKGKKNENLSQHTRKLLYPLWRHMMWMVLCLTLFLLYWCLSFRAFLSLSVFHCLKFPIPICRWLCRTVRAAESVQIAKIDEYCGVVCRQVITAVNKFRTTGPCSRNDFVEKLSEDEDEDGLTPDVSEERLQSRILSILGKEELEYALYVGQPWLCRPKTNIPRYRPRKWGWRMSKGVVFISYVLSQRLKKTQQHFRHGDFYTQKSPTDSQQIKQTKKNWPAVRIREKSVWLVQQSFVKNII